jgi:putative ABC transport system permease protein
VTRLPSLLALAVDGLRRKLGRNLLTASGVFIGVLALTLIVSVGSGLRHAVETTMSSGDNLRQIGLAPGSGAPDDEEKETAIEGEMSEERRQRLRRAAMVRSHPRRFRGTREQTLDPETVAELATIPHVESIVPVVTERYRARLEDREDEETLPTGGVDVARGRLEDRIVAGRYLSGSDADEALVHEYLAYRWGFVRERDLADLVGRTIELRPLRRRGGPFGLSLPPEAIRGALATLDLSSLTEEERASLESIAEKLANPPPAAEDGEDEAPEAPVRTLTIVGVVRDREPGDPFRVVEDGNAFQVDLFLPTGTAAALWLESPVNRQLGFSRAVVTVDDPGRAREVETELRDRGYRAFSVASMLERVERSLGLITLFVSFLTGIALLVAALGIVNTLVTSVVERTAEIGLWKAIGATNGQVRSVFVLEAAILGLFGGLLGLGVAWLLTIPGDALARRIMLEKAWVPVEGGLFRISPWLALGGPLLGAAIAVLASLYPAARAARVDPVRALRHD